MVGNITCGKCGQPTLEIENSKVPRCTNPNCR